MALATGVTYEQELKKNPELMESDVQMLREWCDKQPHLPKIPDVQLALFLHSNYFRIERTKSTIEMYYTMRTHVSEFFANRDPVGSREIRTALQTVAFVILEDVTHDGYNIAYSKLTDVDPSCFNYCDCAKSVNMIVDLWLRDKGTRPGYVFVIDMHGVTLGHVRSLNPSVLKKNLIYLQEGFPIRLMRIHFLNTVPLMNMIMGMVKPFMQKELIAMLHFHSTSESLAKFLPLTALPNDDGDKGEKLSDLMAKNVKLLEDNRVWFQTEEATMRVNEELRPGKGKTASDLFGVKGRFKKLDID